MICAGVEKVWSSTKYAMHTRAYFWQTCTQDYAKVPGLWEGVRSPIKHSWLFPWTTTGCRGADQAITQRTLQLDTDFMNSQLKQDVDRALGVPSNKK